MDRDLLHTTMASDRSAAMPMVQHVFGAYPTGGGSSTSKLIASRRIDALMYPGEHSLLKFAWADRAKEYLAEIKLSRDHFPPGVRRLSHVMTHKSFVERRLRLVAAPRERSGC